MEQPEYNLFERKKVESEYLGLYEKVSNWVTLNWTYLAWIGHHKLVATEGIGH